ncbi:ketopantoate reductase family protein [Geoglobus acetivorans]|uniref:2-dehydropantoate 2-reductase n=1 Tax=Geoglobus acetivorans TaxID=565033 RepID=A0A0A7GJH8_GEOAI|nr:2-dehydropantoate 2-reductase [Geoglobus acetivorans]
MTVMVFGAGALGSLIGALMLKSGQDVVFIARGEQFRALREGGLRVSGLMDGEFEVEVYSRPVDADLVFLTVKAYDTEKAAELLRNVSFEGICSLQNGVGNEDILSSYFSAVVGGVTTYGANLKEPGHVVYAGEGMTFLGDWKGDAARNFADVLKKAGMNVEVVGDIGKRIWEKAAINAVINPLTAICRVRNGKIVEIPQIWTIAKKLAGECEAILDRLGFHVDVENVARDVALRTSLNRSSMLQDVEKGKRTEVEFINGAFVRKGRELGIDAIYNEMMVNLIRGMELGMD